MAKLLVYYAHPGHKHSRVNRSMAEAAADVQGITFVDLYREYPRFNIDIDCEQKRLLEHDVVLFQHPLFWYSTPALIKEWTDLVLEHGFAYGSGGDNLKGKIMMNAISAAGPVDSYTEKGYQHHPLRVFLTPLEQTATLCQMKYAAPYVMFSSLKADSSTDIPKHVSDYRRMLKAIRDDRYDFDIACSSELFTAGSLPIHEVNT